MNIEFFQIAAAAVVIVLIAVTLRDIKKEYAVVMSVVGSVLLLIWCICQMEPIADRIIDLTEMGDIKTEYTEILIKAIGISVSTGIVHDICNDAGETAIASKVDFCGRISLLLISMPLFEELLLIAESIISS